MTSLDAMQDEWGNVWCKSLFDTDVSISYICNMLLMIIKALNLRFIKLHALIHFWVRFPSDTSWRKTQCGACHCLAFCLNIACFLKLAWVLNLESSDLTFFLVNLQSLGNRCYSLSVSWSLLGGVIHLFMTKLWCQFSLWLHCWDFVIYCCCVGWKFLNCSCCSFCGAILWCS